MRWVLILLAAGGAAAETSRTLSFSAGVMTDNEWGELFGFGDDPIAFRDSYLLGAGVGLEWRLGDFGFLGAEANAIAHAGEQTHLELTAPLYYRTPRTRFAAVPSLAYGLGLSWATQRPDVEIDRTGESAQLLAHWFVEAEFGDTDPGWRPFLRIHHRSHAWETFGARTGSNAVMLGVRLVR